MAEKPGGPTKGPLQITPPWGSFLFQWAFHRANGWKDVAIQDGWRIPWRGIYMRGFGPSRIYLNNTGLFQLPVLLFLD
jgi:hypothetical protein